MSSGRNHLIQKIYSYELWSHLNSMCSKMNMDPQSEHGPMTLKDIIIFEANEIHHTICIYSNCIRTWSVSHSWKEHILSLVFFGSNWYIQREKMVKKNRTYECTCGTAQSAWAGSHRTVWKHSHLSVWTSNKGALRYQQNRHELSIFNTTKMYYI